MLGEELYRDIILEHTNYPRNKGELPTATHKHEGLNPICGDQVEMQLQVKDGKVEKAMFSGSGCSISQASASMLASQIEGMPIDEVEKLTEAFKDFMKSRDADVPEGLGELEALAGVRKYPVRIKCALLAWTTLQKALEENA